MPPHIDSYTTAHTYCQTANCKAEESQHTSSEDTTMQLYEHQDESVPTQQFLHIQEYERQEQQQHQQQAELDDEEQQQQKLPQQEQQNQQIIRSNYDLSPTLQSIEQQNQKQHQEQQQRNLQKAEPKVLIFDIGGVLVSETFKLKSLFQKYIQDTKSYEHICRVITEAWSQYRLGKLTEYEFYERVMKKGKILKNHKNEILDFLISEQENIDDTKLRIFIGGEEDTHYQEYHIKHEFIKFVSSKLRQGKRLSTEVVELAKQLKHQNIDIGILSNHSPEYGKYIFHELSDGELSRVFDNPSLIFWSFDPSIQSAKPHERIFQILIQKISEVYPNIQPNNICFIDDKIENVRKAKQFGIYGVHFKSLFHLENKVQKFLS